MVQAERNQQAVQESVDAGADRAEREHPLAEDDQAVVDEGPDEEQRDRHDQRDAGGDDGDGALAREEREVVGQLRVFEPVVAPGADQTADDAHEHVLDLAEGWVDGFECLGAGEQLHGLGLQQGRDRQPRDEARERRGAVRLVSHADRDADCEQQRHVVDERAAGCGQERRGDVVAGEVRDPVADAEEDCGDRQHCHRQHDRSAESLEEFHEGSRYQLCSLC